MIYSVNYIKSNSFMKNPRIRKETIEGDIELDKIYTKPNVPGSVRRYHPKIDIKRNVYLLDITQSELDKLVTQLGFYDNSDNLIDAAPLRNINAPFWKHPDLYIDLQGHGSTFDDSIPIEKFWLACFKADPDFMFSEDELPPSIRSKVFYEVKPVTQESIDEHKKLEESEEAMELYMAIKKDYEKMRNILVAMGTNLKDADPEVVKSSLFRKITSYKDQRVHGSGERNIETFIRLAKSTNKEMSIDMLIQEAREQHVIGKGKGGKYYYNELSLGKNLAEVKDYFNDPENEDILNEVHEKIKK